MKDIKQCGGSSNPTLTQAAQTIMLPHQAIGEDIVKRIKNILSLSVKDAKDIEELTLLFNEFNLIYNVLK